MISTEQIERLHLRISDAGQGDLAWLAKRYYMNGAVDGEEKQVACLEDENRAFKIIGNLTDGSVIIKGLIVAQDKESIERMIDVSISLSGVVKAGGEVIEDPSTDPRLSFLKTAFYIGYDLPLGIYDSFDRLPEVPIT